MLASGRRFGPRLFFVLPCFGGYLSIYLSIYSHDSSLDVGETLLHNKHAHTDKRNAEDSAALKALLEAALHPSRRRKR